MQKLQHILLHQDTHHHGSNPLMGYEGHKHNAMIADF